MVPIPNQIDTVEDLEDDQANGLTWFVETVDGVGKGISPTTVDLEEASTMEDGGVHLCQGSMTGTESLREVASFGTRGDRDTTLDPDHRQESWSGD